MWVSSEELEASTMREVSAWLVANTYTQWSSHRASLPKEGDMTTCMEQARASKLEDAFLVMLVAPVAEEDAPTLVIDATNRVVVINTTPLQHDDPKTFRWRVERQAMRGFGFFLGMRPCGNPRCVAFAYQNLGQLDQIGRNFCPPHAIDLEARVKALGLERPTPPPKPKPPARP